MGLFNSAPKQQLKNINGYIINELTGMLVDVPIGLQVYNIPKEVKQLDPDLNLVSNKVLANLSHANEIMFEDGSISKIPNGYFTYSQSSQVKKITLPKGLISLGDRCIDSTKTKYNLPDTIEYLGTGMYPEVKKLVLGENIKTVGHSFASADTNLEYVEVPGTIKELPAVFVNQCKNLKTLILHEGIEKAGDMAFRGLNNLEYVEIPDSFKMPFHTSMDNRSLSSKRGNSKYDPAGFDAELNNTLTIRKIYNGIPYTFQVRRGDFSEISFKETNAIIQAAGGKSITIDLEKLNKNAICKVNLQNFTIQQELIHQPQQPIQPKAPVQSNNILPRPTQSNTQSQQPPNLKPATSTSSNPVYYNEQETTQYINEIWYYIYATQLYNQLNYATKARLHMELTNALTKKIRSLEKGNKLGEKYILHLLVDEVAKLEEMQENNGRENEEEMEEDREISM